MLFSFSMQGIVPSTFSEYLLNKWISLVLREVIFQLGWQDQFYSKLMTSFFNHKLYFKILLQIFLVLERFPFWRPENPFKIFLEYDFKAEKPSKTRRYET